MREHQRDHTEHAGEDGHQNGTQTGFGGRHGGLREAHARGAAVGGVLRDQDGRFRQQTDQHDDTRLEVDVVLQSHYLGEQERTHQTARNRQNDGERNEETLVQRAQDEVDQQDTDTEDDDRVAARLGLLARDAVELVTVALRKHLRSRFLNGPDGVARRITVGGRTVHGDRTVHVEAVQHLGAVNPRQIYELAQGSHLAAARTHVDVVERLGVETVFRIGLHRHIVHFREPVDVRNILAAVVACQRREDRGRRYAGTLGLRRVDVHHVLREVDVEGRVCAGDLRTLVQRADELQVNIVEFGQVAAGLVLQVHGETGRGSVTRDHRRSHGEDLCVLDVGGAAVNLADDGVHVILLVRTLVPVLEFDDGHTVRRTLSGDHAVTGHLHVVANLRNAVDALRNLLHDLVGLGERGTRGRGDVDHDRTLVLVGNQTRLGGVHQQNQRRDGQAERRPHQPLVLDEEHHAVLVLVDQGSECRVEGLAETRREVVAHLAVLVEVRLQDHGAERRRQRKGVDGRKTHGHGHRDTELRVEDARRSAHHGDGDEHGHEDQRRGHDGRCDTRHGVDGRHVGGFVARVEACLHGFDDDDGVVDDRTDRKNQREEGQQVDRESGECEEAEGSDQRHENRHRGDERRADVLQEDVHDQDHEENGLEQGLDHLFHRGVEEVVHALEMCDGDAFRQFGLQFVEQGVDVVHDLRGVRTGRLEDHRADARMAVGVTFVSVGFAAQFDVGDVLQTQERAVGLREQHDFTELFGRLVASAVFHRVLERVLGVLAQRTGRRFDVLLGQRRRHVRRDELVLGHYVGLQPDAHRVFCAEGEHLADAADTLDARLDVDLQVVRQEGLVVGVIGAVEREDLDHRGLALHGRHTDLRDLGRKLAGGA